MDYYGYKGSSMALVLVMRQKMALRSKLFDSQGGRIEIEH